MTTEEKAELMKKTVLAERIQKDEWKGRRKEFFKYMKNRRIKVYYGFNTVSK